MTDIVKQNPLSKVFNQNGVLSENSTKQPEPMLVSEDCSLGTLNVYIHHAREIQNICIYHKQDVYAKICLTSDPEVSLSTKIINGGGQNPLFDENLQLSVRSMDCSLKCEVWMLSRVKNYLKDQLLGFTLVPLSVIIAENGSFTREFSLSSTDLFHSPAGFVALSFSYVGPLPEVLVISSPVLSATADGNQYDSKNDSPIPCEVDAVQFPDLNVVKENQLMVSEIFGIPCDNLESPCSGSLVTAESDCCLESDAGIRIVESFSTGSVDAASALKVESPMSSVSVTCSPAANPAVSYFSTNPSCTAESQTTKDKILETAEGEVQSSVSQTSVAFAPPLIKINLEPVPNIVQQDIVDMYMKSMQQFTDSLAKMKLPMDIEHNSTDLQNGNSGSEEKPSTAKETGTRVFYGSRAFF